MQVVDAKFVAHWKQYWAPLSWGSMEFSAFLVFAVWTSSMTYLTFGKGELQNMHHFPSLYSFSSPCYLIFRHSLFLFRWFTTADALSLLTCRYDKIKNLNSKKMIFKGRTLSLVNFFCRYKQYLTKAYYYDEPYRKFSAVTKKVRIATMKNCFIQNNFNPNAHQLIFTWRDNQFYQKHFVVVLQTGIR